MPKYYCDYCDVFLTHDSLRVRKTHNEGRKHKDAVRAYYQKWLEDQAQRLIDNFTKVHMQQKLEHAKQYVSTLQQRFIQPNPTTAGGPTLEGYRPPIPGPYPVMAMPQPPIPTYNMVPHPGYQRMPMTWPGMPTDINAQPPESVSNPPGLKLPIKQVPTSL